MSLATPTFEGQLFLITSVEWRQNVFSQVCWIFIGRSSMRSYIYAVVENYYKQWASFSPSKSPAGTDDKHRKSPNARTNTKRLGRRAFSLSMKHTITVKKRARRMSERLNEHKSNFDNVLQIINYGYMFYSLCASVFSVSFSSQIIILFSY